MIQMRCLMRDTWWLWLIAAAATALQVRYMSWFFLVNVPILLVVYVYFALLRYDSHGNSRASWGD